MTGFTLNVNLREQPKWIKVHTKSLERCGGRMSLWGKGSSPTIQSLPVKSRRMVVRAARKYVGQLSKEAKIRELAYLSH